MDRFTFITVLVLSCLTTPLVVNATSPSEPKKQEQIVEAPKSAPAVITDAADQTCARPVRVVYVGYTPATKSCAAGAAAP